MPEWPDWETSPADRRLSDASTETATLTFSAEPSPRTTPTSRYSLSINLHRYLHKILAEIHDEEFPQPIRALIAKQRNSSRLKVSAEAVRAGHWINYPLLISQPIVPIALYFWSISSAAALAAAFIPANILWIRVVSQYYASMRLTRIGELIATTKWFVSPASALMLLYSARPATAVLALSWPILLIPILTMLHRFWPAQSSERTQRALRRSAHV